MNDDPTPQSTEPTPANLSQLVRRTIGKLGLSLRHYYALVSVSGVLLSCFFCEFVNISHYRLYDPTQYEPFNYFELTGQYAGRPNFGPDTGISHYFLLVALLSGGYALYRLRISITLKVIVAFGMLFACCTLSFSQLVYSSTYCDTCEQSVLYSRHSIEFEKNKYTLLLEHIIDGEQDAFAINLVRCENDYTTCYSLRINDALFEDIPVTEIWLEDDVLLFSVEIIGTEKTCYQIKANSEDFEVAHEARSAIGLIVECDANVNG